MVRKNKYWKWRMLKERGNEESKGKECKERDSDKEGWRGKRKWR